MKPRLLAISLLAITTSALAQSAAPVKRTPIATVELSPNKTVTHVQVTRIDYLPGQMTGRHIHPMPVAGYVESGSFVVQVHGQAERHYKTGEVIYEPANTVIERFDNDSSSAPAVLIANYLAGAGAKDKTLVKLLPAK
jgi:quercetin dioxygenase-like cupin family protein